MSQRVDVAINLTEGSAWIDRYWDDPSHHGTEKGENKLVRLGNHDQETISLRQTRLLKGRSAPPSFRVHGLEGKKSLFAVEAHEVVPTVLGLRKRLEALH
jgi:hypothetical protein